MKMLKVGDFVWTYDGVGSGIIIRIGAGVFEIDNNVNVNTYRWDEVLE
jgi:hypothetical protein